jgi:hypothetical protein
MLLHRAWNRLISHSRGGEDESTTITGSRLGTPV